LTGHPICNVCGLLMYDSHTSQAAFAHLVHPVNVYGTVEPARLQLLVNGYEW